VVGEGATGARLLILGEAPGADEVREGRPFRGRAGQNLDLLLVEAGVARDQVWVTNVVACRPFRLLDGTALARQVGNVNPSGAAMKACAQGLDAELEAVDPDAMVAVGVVSASRLYRKCVTLKDVNGRVGSYLAGDRTIPFLATYHPSPLSVNRAKGRRELIRAALERAWNLSPSDGQGHMEPP